MSYLDDVVPVSVDDQRRATRRNERLFAVLLLACCGFFGLVAVATSATPFALAFVLLCAGIVAVAWRPQIGLYLIGFFLFTTDGVTSPTYPFGKNLSSNESMLFLNNALYVSPAEIILGLTLVCWLLRLLLDRRVTFISGSLVKPLMVFAAFLILGFAYGIGRGGDRYVAIWEFRPILQMPVVYILATNLFTTRRQYRRLLLVMGAALVMHGLLALRLIDRVSAVGPGSLESPISHPSAVQLNVVLFIAAAAFLIPGTSRWMRIGVPIMAIPVGWAYLISQRRAALVALLASFAVLAVVASRLNRRRLMVVGPIFAIIFAGYVGAFWNSTSTAGFPAQAVKSVIAPSSVGTKDQSSDLYRVFENIDIVATIKANPITGFGFGQRFLRPVALPDISFFPFYEYISHNSVLWIWIKAGIGGFVAMLFLFGSALRRGVATTLSIARGDDAVIACACVAYPVMYLVFAYVDIAWDGRNMFALGIALAICSQFTRLPSGAPPPPRLAAVVSDPPAPNLVALGP